MVAVLSAIGVLLVAGLAEWLHQRRIRRVAYLVYGPARRPAAWAHLAPLLRVAAVTAIVWGAVALLQLPPKVHELQLSEAAQMQHLLIVLDVSPSMRLQDAGPDGAQTRRQRAADLLESFFERVQAATFRVSVIAVYNGAKPVVVATRDQEVVRNILNDLPLEYAFRSGKTDIFAGLKEAAEVARPWNPASAILMLVTDGDTVPSTGMPPLPASIKGTVVVGVGNPRQGSFIDGQLSRQDAATLRQVAHRLRGTYHNGNERHLSTELIGDLTGAVRTNFWQQLTLREYAPLAIGCGAVIVALLPVALHWLGTLWRPGVPPARGWTNPPPQISLDDRREPDMMGVEEGVTK